MLYPKLFIDKPLWLCLRTPLCCQRVFLDTLEPVTVVKGTKPEQNADSKARFSFSLRPRIRAGVNTIRRALTVTRMKQAERWCTAQLQELPSHFCIHEVEGPERTQHGGSPAVRVKLWPQEGESRPPECAAFRCSAESRAS